MLYCSIYRTFERSDCTTPYCRGTKLHCTIKPKDLTVLYQLWYGFQSVYRWEPSRGRIWGYSSDVQNSPCRRALQHYNGSLALDEKLRYVDSLIMSTREIWPKTGVFRDLSSSSSMRHKLSDLPCEIRISFSYLDGQILFSLAMIFAN